ncbi:putative sugar kinase YdjH [Hartmannibacter diazotrophicus]|uniref:Putative sugar kinase YdjH n=1 Tax=Hartmannibacter diazotrophicus TaxID=1482074 RepID=A0A2C9DB07_9HYPH|nr:PfkB family carbohydrate kinase [Hartmannibacter diazotrophicus]SON56785.1 putative sugar kinase YdjH [Hartmannibacter diazotrophicus]
MRPLAVIGNVNVDLILGPAAPWPAPGTEIMVDHDELRVGGAAGNSALVWQALGLDFQIAANVGSDEFGRWLKNAFADKAAGWPERPEATTLSVGITHPDGERTFFTTRGHLPRFSLADALSCLDRQALSGGFLLLCGSFLTDDLTGDYEALFDWADANSITVALDTGWPLTGWTGAIRLAARSWLKRCGLVLMNEVEVTTLAEVGDADMAARLIRSWMPEGGIVVVKRGGAGAMAIDADGSRVSAAAPPVRVIDTIGAGDVFNAAFLGSFADGASLTQSLAAGVSIASHAVSTHPREYRAVPVAVEATP